MQPHLCREQGSPIFPILAKPAIIRKQMMSKACENNTAATEQNKVDQGPAWFVAIPGGRKQPIAESLPL